MICQDYFWHLFCLFFFSNTCRIAVFLTSGTHFFLFCQKLSRIRNAGSPKPCSFEKREIPAQSTTARITCVLSATNSSSDHIILNLVEKLMLVSWHTNANLYTPAIRTNHSCRGISRVPTAGWRNAPAYSQRGSTREGTSDWADLALRQAHKNTRSRVVRAAGA